MISQYWLCYTLQKDWAFGQMAKKSNEQSVEEMNHADMLIVWIILLEGQSNLYSPDPLRISQTPKGTLERDLAIEQATQRCPPILPRRWGFRHHGAV